MKKKETVVMQNEYIDALTKNLHILRTATNMTQVRLANKIGVSRQTIVAIETRKRPMPWSLYLAMVLVFENNEDSHRLLINFKLFDEEFLKQIT